MNGKMVKFFCVAGLVASMSLFSAGCSKQPVQSEEGAVETTETGGGSGGGAGGSGGGTSSTGPAADTGDTAGSYESIESTPGSNGGATAGPGQGYAVVEGRTNEGLLPIYFDFDQFIVRDDQKSRIEGNAAFLQANPNLNIVVEGNCDERGTNEYNIALGERRALSAKNYLQNLGVVGTRISTVSYGEEKPLLYGHDEYSWSQNRRDDFVIQ